MVRKAIMHAINKKDITAKATSNVCRVSDRMFAPEILPENKNLTLYDYNPKKAEEFLDRAGYPKKSGGVRFSLQILVRAGETDEEKTADLLKDYLKEVGIDLTIKKVDFNTTLQLQCNYQYELATQKKGNVPFFNYQQHHSKWIRPGKILSNISQYSNPKVDSLYDQWVYQATSDEERNKAILEAESILTDELPEAPLFDVAWMYIWSKRVKNAFVPARFMFQSESFEEVYISK
jgi:peptide/nickel transport system substrate-binding protein